MWASRTDQAGSDGRQTILDVNGEQPGTYNLIAGEGRYCWPAPLTGVRRFARAHGADTLAVETVLARLPSLLTSRASSRRAGG
jgi:hypothetical protein